MMKRRAEEEFVVTDNKRRTRKMMCPFPSVLVLHATPCYDSMKFIKPALAVEIEYPKTHINRVMSNDYRSYGKLTPYIDTNGVSVPLDSWMEIVPAINRYMKTCVNGKIIKTYYSDDTCQPIRPPSGLHLFAVPREITACLIRDAFQDASNLYWNSRHRANHVIHQPKLTPSPACNLLFYPGCGKGPVKIRDIFQILFAEAPSLAKYVMIYLSVIRDILRLDHEDMESVVMNLNHYDPMGAINPHVDTVFMFDGTLGPIFTVAMGPCEKMLDLLPVLLPDMYKPLRVFSKPNEIMLMDGEARTLWAHGKPWNYPYEQYTLVFKFPEFRTKTHSTLFEYEGTPLSIPYHYVSPAKARV